MNYFSRKSHGLFLQAFSYLFPVPLSVMTGTQCQNFALKRWWLKNLSDDQRNEFCLCCRPDSNSERQAGNNNEQIFITIISIKIYSVLIVNNLGSPSFFWLVQSTSLQEQLHSPWSTEEMPPLPATPVCHPLASASVPVYAAALHCGPSASLWCHGETRTP